MSVLSSHRQPCEGCGFEHAVVVEDVFGEDMKTLGTWCPECATWIEEGPHGDHGGFLLRPRIGSSRTPIVARFAAEPSAEDIAEILSEILTNKDWDAKECFLITIGADGTARRLAGPPAPGE